MKLNQWKWVLVILAGLIWLTILTRHNISGSAPAPAGSAGLTPQSQPRGAATPSRPAPSTGGLSSLAPLRSSGRPTATPRPTAPPVYHEVQAGEAPGIIAAAYGIAVETLMEINHITDPTTLQIGQKLLIPVTATPSNKAATPKASPSPSPTPHYYMVQAGDVLLAIAAEYETSVEAIMIANEIIDPRALQVGQKLLIPPDKGSILGVPTIIHEIEAGDTLLALAARYGSTLDDILVSNPDLEPSALQIGQKIIIPLTQPGANRASPPTLPRLTAPAPTSPELAALEQGMAAAVNAQRQAHGLPLFTVNEQLTIVARAHAQDMVSRGYFSHVTPEGLALRDRLETAGLRLNWTGENIQRNTQATTVTVPYALDWFMSSRPHRNNILHEHYSRFGVGVAEGPPGWYTFVLVFAGD
ncbi:MAG: LysM peptidoglycan-binding domain-containing protein [Chloroflexota bacterium]